MNTPRSRFRLGLIVALLACAAPLVMAADSSELAEARAQLLDAYRKGRSAEEKDVKQLRAKIEALEYVAAHTPPDAPASEQRLITVDFPGGPMSALLAATEKSSPSGFNVIAEKADLAIELPPFSVRNADPVELANALTGILQPRGYTLTSSYRSTPGRAPVFTLRKLGPYEGRVDHRLLPQFQSFQLGPYLEYQTVDDIVGAVRTAWELDPMQSPDALRVKFHPPTGILLVSGPQQAIHVVENILRQLRRNPDPTPKPTPKPGSPPVPEKR